jgi:hypothetical protein
MKNNSGKYIQNSKYLPSTLLKVLTLVKSAGSYLLHQFNR